MTVIERIGDSDHAGRLGLCSAWSLSKSVFGRMSTGSDFALEMSQANIKDERSSCYSPEE